MMCCSARHGQYSDAIVLLNKAIKEEKKEASLYINRGGKFVLLSHFHLVNIITSLFWANIYNSIPFMHEQQNYCK